MDRLEEVVRELRGFVAEREWEQIQMIREDFQTLTDESLESLKVLLTSLAAERREDLLKGL